MAWLELGRVAAGSDPPSATFTSFSSLGNLFIDFLLLLLRHRLKGRDAGTLYGVKAQAAPDKVEIVDDFTAAVDALRDHAGEGLAEKARAMYGYAAWHKPGRPMPAASKATATCAHW